MHARALVCLPVQPTFRLAFYRLHVLTFHVFKSGFESVCVRVCVCVRAWARACVVSRDCTSRTHCYSTRPGQGRVYGITISFCISTSLPMQFVQKPAQKSTNIVLGCEVVTRRPQPRFQWTLSRSLPTTGFYDSVDSGRVRHRSRFLLNLDLYPASCTSSTTK